jgi:hypothetical protein
MRSLVVVAVVFAMGAFRCAPAFAGDEDGDHGVALAVTRVGETSAEAAMADSVDGAFLAEVLQ